jgi:zinc protease
MKFDGAFEAKVEALTAEQVNAAVRRHLDPAGFVIVKAGDFKKAGVLQ